MARTILHVDMDAFYAAVEQRDNPQLAGKPVIVGGTGNRGVVSTASYEARPFGVHSAQPTALARRLCPQGIFLPVRMDRYREVSRQIFGCFHTITDQVEGLSLDEAFLDVSDCKKLFGSPQDVALRIKNCIRSNTGLTASVGIAPNKFLAKLASDLEKPDGLVVVHENTVQQLLDPLPVTRLWGIGKKAASRLNEAGIMTIGELRLAEDRVLHGLLGNQAGHFLSLARGIDDRTVQPERDEKSISSEETFEQDLADYERLSTLLMNHAETVGRRLRAAGLGATTVTLKLRQSNFALVTRRRSLAVPTSHTMTIYQTAREMLKRWLQEHPQQRLRLIGVGVANLRDANQADLFTDRDSPGDNPVDRVMDRIRDQYGSNAVTRGRLLGNRRR